MTDAGLIVGELPPSAGWLWQLVHWSALNRPPSPAEFVTPAGAGVPGVASLQVSHVASSSVERNFPSIKRSASFAFSPGTGWPAFAAPALTPGSCGTTSA